MKEVFDSMGKMFVPEDALYGASTKRAFDNFPISDHRFSQDFITILAEIKLFAAKVNAELNLLSSDKAEAIIAAAKEIKQGKFYEQFILDVYQTGSGTSTNMNVNEVLANRASLLGNCVLHPNDDVNLGQSSNDVFPTAMHVAAVLAVKNKLIPALENLTEALFDKAEAFKNIIKAGRTHLQDATPISLGQEFSGYATQIKQAQERIQIVLDEVRELPLGGTAVGTGLNTHPLFAGLVIKYLNQEHDEKFYEANNHFAAQASQDSILSLSGTFKTLACTLIKIANDVRWLAAGPRCNLAEINLPALQPGSSIMPAKVNPVICESVLMVAAQVIGYDITISLANQHGNFELNTMMPVMVYSLLDGITILANVSNNFADKCIKGITVNQEKCHYYAESTFANCTALAPLVGYDMAAKIAKKAMSDGITIKEAALSMNVLSQEIVEQALDLKKMI